MAVHEYGDYGVLSKLVYQFLKRTNNNGYNNFPCSTENYRDAIYLTAEKQWFGFCGTIIIK